MERNVQMIRFFSGKRPRILCLLLITVLMTGCASQQISQQFTLDSSVSAFTLSSPGGVDLGEGRAQAFAHDLCLRDDATLSSNSVDLSQALSGILCDVNKHRVIYAKDENMQLPPASLTKVMTALVALDNCTLDETLTASENVKINESGATLCGLEPGDTMTMDQALHALLMQSANDAAIMIAEHVGGSVEGFAQMMNDKAKSLGATGCNFVNPHGLTADGHLVTAYDMYLIFAAAMQYETFTSIIHMDHYDTVYHDAQGNGKSYETATTNLFLKGDYQSPEGITVVGGKTGTTTAARNCLVLLSRDSAGNPYVAVILGASERQYLYQEMVSLLGKIG
ncbi:MAG: serine hydrolase [Lachnospiraceae bacterium]|nr:serine hydrolase [Lachnospiraceae bacterium]